MQQKIIEHFIELTQIPHCSKEADKLLTFLETFSKTKGYEVEIDETKNIYIHKGTPKLALQAHYDMVCMGKAPVIEPYIEEEWMMARVSSLGADNGMAIAMMMVLMERGEELEFVITADEEIGLVGAAALAFELKSDYMLNLDFEDEAEVCIGCAGGADILATQQFASATSLPYRYRVSVSDLTGGHSGVDIDKNIPNAIKELAAYLSNKAVKLSSLEGGERRNSIPVNAVAQLTSAVELVGTDMVHVEPIDEPLSVYESDALLTLLHDFQHGVDRYNEAFNLPDTSINLAIVHFQNGRADIETSARAMSAEGLTEICHKNLELFSAHGFKSQEKYKYPSWKPEINTFTQLVGESMEKVFGHNEYKAIHAGLECGLISEKYPDMLFASIGPTIQYPHSTRERVNLESVEKTFAVVEDIIAKL